MCAKNALAIQRCELSRKELDEFLSFYPIPLEYRVILPTSTQTILDAPPGYIGLYTYCFFLANLRLPLNDFFCEVHQYFKVHISRLNPFGCSKLTTFIVMRKAYDCEPSVKLFCSFFNLYKAGSWLTFQKRSEKHISSLLAKVITRIEEMSFRKFIYIEDDEDLTFLPKDFSLGFNTGSLSVSINTNPVRTDEEHAVEPATELVNERVGTTADSGGGPKGNTFVVHAGSVAALIRERKFKTRGGSLRPLVKRNLASGSSTSCIVRAKASVMKDDTPVLSIFDDDDEVLPWEELVLSSLVNTISVIVSTVSTNEVIVNGDAHAPITSASGGSKAVVPPKTNEQKIARRNELKAKITLLLSIPDEHLLKFHGEDANLKLLRSLPSAWNNIALIMRNKSDLDTLSMDDLYNNLKVYESEIKSQTSSSSNSQNVAFVSSENTSSANEVVNIAHDFSDASSQGQASSSTYVDNVLFSFFANQSNSLQFDNEALEKIDTDDLEEMDLKLQVAMLTMRVKRFIKKTRRNLNFNDKETVDVDKIKVECYNCHRRGHFARECRIPRNQDNRNGDNTQRVIPVETPANALVVTNGMGYDWSYQAEEGPTNFALMAFTSQGSSSLDTEVHTSSKEYLQSYQTLQKQYDQQCDVLNKANLEIIAYQLGLESLEARIVVHQKNEAVYEEDIAFLKYDVKTGLSFDSQMNENELHDSHLNKSEVFECVSNSSVNECEEDNDQVNDRFKKVEGYHAVPPPYTENYMPSRPDLSFAGLDDSVYKSKVSETITSMPNIETTASKTSKDSLEKPKIVRPSAPLIEEWESDSDDDCVIRPSIEQNKPSYAKINFVKSDENTRKSVIEQHTYRQAENLRRRKSVLKGRATGHREVRPVWNNAQRVNHKNFSNNLTYPHPRRNFVPSAVITKSGKVPVNTAKQNSPRATTSSSIAKYVNTIASRPTVNGAKPSSNVFHKSHSPIRRSFNKRAAPKNSFLKEKVNIVKGNPQYALQDQGIFASGCYRHMTSNKTFLTDYQEIDGGFVAFRGSPKEGKITGKGKIRTGKLDFEDVYFVKELKFNLFFVSQMCDKKNSVLFTETEWSGPEWLFDIDSLTKSMNYEPLTAGNHTNGDASIDTQSSDDKDADEVPGKGDGGVCQGSKIDDQERTDSSTQDVNTAVPIINTINANINIDSLNINTASPIPNDSSMQSLEETGIFDDAYDDRDVGDLNNLETTMNVSPILTTRIHKDHPKDQIIGDPNLATQTRRMIKFSKEHAMKVIQALKDLSWVEAMQEELLQFRLLKVWRLVYLPKGKHAIGTKWVYRNKKDERGIVVRNKARLMDVKSTFLYGTIEEEVYVFQPPGFEDPQFPDKVYKVEKALYGLHQDPKAWYATLSTYLLENGFRRSTIDKTLFIKKDIGDILLVQVKQKDDGIFISQDKYVADILKKFDFATVKTTSTPIEPNKALLKDEEAEDVDVHLYRSMIGSLMYLTAFRLG
ncbi:ribonuclease H-like domain-containing protein [Tanacetum coccineum]